MQLRGKQLHVSATTPRHKAPLGRHHLVTKGAVHHRQLRVNLVERGIPYCLCCQNTTGHAFWVRVSKKWPLRCKYSRKL